MYFWQVLSSLYQFIIFMKAIFMTGPSGAGKSTLSSKLHSLHCQLFGQNSAILINLDCANEHQSDNEVDICELVRLQDIMEDCELGPNGSILYAAELLETNIQWLYNQIESAVHKRNPSAKIIKNPKTKSSLNIPQLQTDNLLLIFDLPGQTQLFLNHSSLRNIIFALIQRFSLQAVMLQLFDATYLYNLADFVSMTMMSLASICSIGITHICVLNKIDLCKGRRPADGTFDSYFGVASLTQLLQDNLAEDNPVARAIAQLVDQYKQASFSPCSIYNPDLILSLFLQLEKIFGTLQSNLLAFRQFSSEVKDLLSEQGEEKVRVNLQAQLFADEQEGDLEQQIRKMKEGR